MKVILYNLTRKNKALFPYDNPVTSGSFSDHFPVKVKLQRSKHENWPVPVIDHHWMPRIAPEMLAALQKNYGTSGGDASEWTKGDMRHWRWAYKVNKLTAYFYFRNLNDAVFFRLLAS